MRIAFMGTPDFSLSALQAILGAGHNIVAVYTQIPRPAGRGKKERQSPVHEFASNHNIPVHTPLNFKKISDVDVFKKLNLDLAVVVAYGLLLPQEILDAPKFGCLNIHASLLPRWRGAAPIQRAVMAGDQKTGIGIMQMEAGLDTGPIILEKSIAIASSDTAGSLHDKLSTLGAKAITEALDYLSDLSAVPQNSNGVIYAEKIKKSEAHIDWSKSANDLKNHIHGMSPFPGAWTEFNGERLKILSVEVSDQSGPSGQMISAPLTIACGNKSLNILHAQRAGKELMNIEDLIRGVDINLGATFK